MADLLTPKSVIDVLDFVWAGDAGGFNPLDATVYFSGQFPALDPSTAQTAITLQVPYNCTVIGAVIKIVVSGILGSNENTSAFAIRANGTTDSTLASGFLFNAVAQTFNVTGLSISITAGDNLQLKLTAATFATNPTGVLYQCSLVVRVNQ